MALRERLHPHLARFGRIAASGSAGLSHFALGGAVAMGLLTAFAPAEVPAPLEPRVIKVRTLLIPESEAADTDTRNGALERVAESRSRRSAKAKREPTPAAKEPEQAAPKELPPPPQPLPQHPPPEVTPAPAWTDAEVAAALAQCVKLLGPVMAEVEPQAPVRNGECGTPAPVLLKRIGKDAIPLQPPAMTNCLLAAKLYSWVEDVLQPAARELLGSPVAKLVGTASYVCRNRNGDPNGPISEHAFANALDISGFMLADGRIINVLADWGPVARDKLPATPTPATTPSPAPAIPRQKAAPSALAGPKQSVPPPADLSPNAQFLRRVHAKSCGLFGTVLGPEANEAHRNHLHLDMKSRRRAFCE